MNKRTPAQILAQAAPVAALQKGDIGNVSQSCPKVKVEIGVFFDGTGNNRQNVLTGLSSNGPSNVDRLLRLYPRDLTEYAPCGSPRRRVKRLYVEGIGTLSGRDDDGIGSGTGAGSRGVEARVYRACTAIGRMVDEMSPRVEPEEVILDVFGFSRGAAAARYFVNCFRQGYIKYLKYYVFPQHASLPKGRKVRIRFIGIFDTVAAIGLNANNANNGAVNVHLKAASADSIFHITAADEFRHNFSLNRNTPGGGATVELPGAHSDIGGGYAEEEKEDLLMKPATGRIFSSYEEARRQHEIDSTNSARVGAPEAARMVAEGWIGNPKQYYVQPTAIRTFTIPNPSAYHVDYAYDIEHRVRRNISNGWSKAVMALMHKKAREAGVPFSTIPNTTTYKVPDDLKPAQAAILGGRQPSAADKKLIKLRYTHHSSHYLSMARGLITPHKPAAGRVRGKHPNLTGRAK